MKAIAKKEIYKMIKDEGFYEIRDKILEIVKNKLEGAFNIEIKQFNSFYYLRFKKNENESLDKSKLRSDIINIDKENNAWRGFVLYSLAIICLKGGQITRNEFENHTLIKLDTSMFGEPKKIVNELKKQKWIKEFKDIDDNEILQYGLRANFETNMINIYKMAYKICKDSDVPSNDQTLKRLINEHKKLNKQGNKDNFISNNNDNSKNNTSRKKNVVPPKKKRRTK